MLNSIHQALYTANKPPANIRFRTDLSHSCVLSVGLNSTPPHLVIRAKKPISGRSHRSPQPSLRGSEVVHVDSATPTGVSSALRGLPERGYPFAPGDFFNAEVSVGWFDHMSGTRQKPSFTNTCAIFSTTTSGVEPSRCDVSENT